MHTSQPGSPGPHTGNSPPRSPPAPAWRASLRDAHSAAPPPLPLNPLSLRLSSPVEVRDGSLHLWMDGWMRSGQGLIHDFMDFSYASECDCVGIRRFVQRQNPHCNTGRLLNAKRASFRCSAVILKKCCHS
ncbi:hypothetical protein ILYODFUR_031119 [Ilyodon furcidens]|uniref:Uncharacterized protein n=1 Tax=Ilyodon furcidens TaxID=33524 RepID=A0ABV0UMB0_9TELE